MSRKSARLLQSFAVTLWALMLLLFCPNALAAGKIEWKTKTLKEVDKAWKVEIAIYLPKAPDIPTLPMRFEFQPVMYYERSMLDGDKLVERKVPLENHQALIEGVDVGFLDPGSGKIEKRTKFIFKLTRGHGYEAGEYQVTIRDGRSGDVVGTPSRLIFQGENEIVDRRAMVFTGNEKKKKKPAEDSPKPEADAKAQDTKTETSDKPADEAQESGEPAASETAAAAPESEAAAPPPVKEKPGGCGCRIHGSSPNSGAALSIALGAFAFAARRRGRRSGARERSPTS